MIVAQLSMPLVIVLGVAAFVGIVVSAVFLFRGYEHSARRSLERRYTGLNIHTTRRPGDVALTYHTYHGLIVWFTQTPHHVALPPDDARVLLGRLLRFNLTWGLVTYGVVFVVPLAVFNYLAQRRSIGEQEARAGFPTPETGSTTSSLNREIVESPSAVFRAAGWISAGLCVPFAVSLVVCLFQGEFEGAVGVAIVLFVLGSVARSWITDRPK